MQDNPSSERPIDPQELRQASLPQTLLGYDRSAVHELLDRAAEALEGAFSAAGGRAPQLRRELERVGERTAAILTAAEEAASKLREEALEQSEALRAQADEESRKALAEASRKAEEIVAGAQERAERIVEAAIARRRALSTALDELAERRDAVAAELGRLAEELAATATSLRALEVEREPEGGEAREVGEAGETAEADESPGEGKPQVAEVREGPTERGSEAVTAPGSTEPAAATYAGRAGAEAQTQEQRAVGADEAGEGTERTDPSEQPTRVQR